MGNVGYSTPFSPPVDARARTDAATQAHARDLEAALNAERVAREADAWERRKKRREAAVADGVAACDAAAVFGDREWEYGGTAAVNSGGTDNRAATKRWESGATQKRDRGTGSLIVHRTPTNDSLPRTGEPIMSHRVY
jgi:hypothetical protein